MACFIITTTARRKGESWRPVIEMSEVPDLISLLTRMAKLHFIMGKEIVEMRNGVTVERPTLIAVDQIISAREWYEPRPRTARQPEAMTTEGAAA
ncbi:hypothetical protein SAMN05519104_6700 [Rhizobiales bacterium GAS188]|nr:hypothetical protein SAMN05519104_6700 [Rhizobiales bacterium GAS188]